MKKDMKSLMESWNKFSIEIEKEKVLVEHSVKNILADKELRKLFLEDYKATLSEGQQLTEKGFRDFIKGAKEKYLGSSGIDWEKQERELDNEKAPKKSFIKKTLDVGKGVLDIGFLGRGSTLLGGEETFDIEKRNELRSSALSELQRNLDGLQGALKNANISTGVDVAKLFQTLDSAGFPNNKQFEQNLEDIEKTYDQVVSEWNERKYDSRTANTMIAVLRQMMIYFQDFKIADKNLYLKEEDGISDEDAFFVKGSSENERSKNYDAAYGNKMPAGIVIAGASMIGAHIVAGSDLFNEIFNSLKGGEIPVTEQDPQKISQKVSEQVSLLVAKNQGITQAVHAATGVAMDPSAPISNFWDPKVVPLHGSIEKAIAQEATREGNLKEAMAAWKNFLAMAKGSDGSQTMGKVLKGTMSGTGASPIDLFDIKPGEYFSGDLAQKAVTAGTKAAKMVGTAGGKMAAIAAIKAALGVSLLDMGIGLVAGGVTSKLLRMKGQSSSRMASLQQMRELMVDVGTKKDAVVPQKQAQPGGPEVPTGKPTQPVSQPDLIKKEPTDVPSQSKKSVEKDILTDLRNAFVKDEEFLQLYSNEEGKVKKLISDIGELVASRKSGIIFRENVYVEPKNNEVGKASKPEFDRVFNISGRISDLGLDDKLADRLLKFFKDWIATTDGKIKDDIRGLIYRQKDKKIEPGKVQKVLPKRTAIGTDALTRNGQELSPDARQDILRSMMGLFKDGMGEATEQDLEKILVYLIKKKKLADGGGNVNLPGKELKEDASETYADQGAEDFSYLEKSEHFKTMIDDIEKETGVKRKNVKLILNRLLFSGVLLATAAEAREVRELKLAAKKEKERKQQVEKAHSLTQSLRIKSDTELTSEKTALYGQISKDKNFSGLPKALVFKLLDVFAMNKMLPNSSMIEKEKVQENLVQIEREIIPVLAQKWLNKEDWGDVKGNSLILALQKKLLQIPELENEGIKILKFLEFLFVNKLLYIPKTEKGIKEIVLQEPKQTNEQLNRWKQLAGIIK